MTATYTIQQKIQFLQQIYPYAVNTSNTSGLSLELMLSQAVQETGWGEKVLPGTNNIFNIKADSSWSGPTATFTVREFIGDHYEFVVSEFRVYPSYAESFADRVTFLSENPGYAKLFDPSIMGDLAKEADALQNAHYATDPSYAKHLIEIPTGRTFKAAIATLNYHVSDVALQLELDKALGILDELDKIDLGQSIVQRPLDSTATSFAAASIYVTPVRRDPLVLDLDGDGIETLPINTTTPVMFDLDNFGVKKSVGWIKSDDGFLVMDRNGNGTIDTGAELFGDATRPCQAVALPLMALLHSPNSTLTSTARSHLLTALSPTCASGATSTRTVSAKPENSAPLQSSISPPSTSPPAATLSPLPTATSSSTKAPTPEATVPSAAQAKLPTAPMSSLPPTLSTPPLPHR